MPSSGRCGVPARLLTTPLRRDPLHRHVGGRRAGEHVAGVALVSGGVGEHERAPLGGKEAIGDVDRDPLLALGAQAVGDRREVRLAPIVRDVIEVVGEQRAGVEQEPADQRALAVVDGPGGRKPQQLALVVHQK